MSETGGTGETIARALGVIGQTVTKRTDPPTLEEQEAARKRREYGTPLIPMAWNVLPLGEYVPMPELPLQATRDAAEEALERFRLSVGRAFWGAALEKSGLERP